MTLLGPGAPGMAFMMKKKKYKFNVEVTLEELVEVALVNEVLFAKIRLLDGGSFVEYSSREEVKNHTVKWNQKFEILCKMSANASTGVLDTCYLRISIRKEMKGGRSYYKLGFIDINLAEYAGSGEISRRFLLEGYDQRHRLDNSMLLVSLKMHMLSGDILFKAPSPASKERTKDGVIVNNEDGKTPQEDSPLEGATPIIATSGTRPISSSRDDIISHSQTSSGFGSLTKKKSDFYTSEIDPNALIASIVTDSGLSESSEPTIASDSFPSLPPTSLTSLASNAQQILPSCGSGGGIGGTGGSGGGGGGGGVSSSGGGTGNISSQVGVIEMGHSRNSSNTSQMSKGSGYSSFSHSQHSRQSSEGDSGHARFQKSFSLLSKLNQRALQTAMKLNIPSLLNSNNYINQKRSITSASTLISPSESGCGSGSATIDNEGNVYLTPNSSIIVTDQNSEEYRTPLSETPNKILLISPSSPPSLCTIITPTTTITATTTANMNSDADDSGLDETFHSPRIPKMKSLEDLNILDMQFREATLRQQQQRQHEERNQMQLQLNSVAGKLKHYHTNNSGKMKSLNNLVFDGENNDHETGLRQEIEKLKNDSLLFKEPLIPPSVPKMNGKCNRNKIGITKFLGNDESEHQNYPITKIKSLGTIPDVVTDPIRYDPFLTPITSRRNTLSLEGDINDTVDTLKVQRMNRRESSPDIENYETALLRQQQQMNIPVFERGFRRYGDERSNSANFGNCNSFNGGGGGVSSHASGFVPTRQSDGFICYTDGRSVRSAQQQIMRNPSSGSLVISETGSLDRMKTAAEKRKKVGGGVGTLDDAPTVSDRVEETRVNPDSLIDEILKDTKLDQLKETTEPSGLQLYIARDGTASLGSHRVKSHVTAGAIKQVVMENPR